MRVPYSIEPDDFDLLRKVIAATARTKGLSAENADEFSQWAHLKLLERNYAPLARFAGHSSLHTYLSVVVRRMLLDWRNERYGKWRPSAWARRHGPIAVELDRLVTRDGHTRTEAVAILTQRGGADPASLSRLQVDLPGRCRPQMVGCGDVEEIAAAMTVWTDPIEYAEDAAERRRTQRRLQKAVSELAPSDQRLLYLRFYSGLSVTRIAALLEAPPKSVYPRIQRLLHSLRQRLASPVLAGTVRRGRGTPTRAARSAMNQLHCQ